MKVYQYHINDTEFAKALVDSFLEIHKRPNITSPKQRVIEPDASSIPSKTYRTISYNLTNFPDAKPGKFCSLIYVCYIKYSLSY